MKKLKLLLLVLVSTLMLHSQSLYLPTNPDSLLIPVNLNNTVRKVYAIDLVRFSTFLSNYYNKTQVDGLFGSYYTKIQSDARYLQSFTETDPLSILRSGTTNLTGGITINGTASGFPVLFATTRVQHTTGANVAAANNLTLGNDGNTFSITGNTQINAITNTNWQSGASVNLLFTGTPTLKHNTAGGAGTSVLDLAGDADWTAAPGDIVSLVYVGSKWVETTRKIAGVNGSRGSVTDVSVVSTNGFAGTVSNSRTTPAISIKTTVTGILKGNGTTGVVSAATPGTDYLNNITGLVTAGSNISRTGTGVSGDPYVISSTGGLDSVDFILLNDTTLVARQNSINRVDTIRFSYGNNLRVNSIVLNTENVIYTTPVTFTNTSGNWATNLVLKSQTAKTFLAAPNGASGTPTFRAILPSDISAGTLTAGYVPTVQSDGSLLYQAQSGAGGSGGWNLGWTTTTSGYNSTIGTNGSQSFRIDVSSKPRMIFDSVVNTLDVATTLIHAYTKGFEVRNSQYTTQYSRLLSDTGTNQILDFLWPGNYPAGLYVGRLSDVSPNAYTWVFGSNYGTVSTNRAAAITASTAIAALGVYTNYVIAQQKILLNNDVLYADAFQKMSYVGTGSAYQHIYFVGWGNVATWGSSSRTGHSGLDFDFRMGGAGSTDMDAGSLLWRGFGTGGTYNMAVGPAGTDVTGSRFTVHGDQTRGSIPAPRMTTTQRLTLSSGIQLLGFSTANNGTGYTPGTYTNVPLTGGTGTGATANITISAGGVVSAFAMNQFGTGYVVGDVLSASSANLGGTGSGFSKTVGAGNFYVSEGMTVYDLTLHKNYTWDGTTWNAWW